jgi:hypothetical protein
MTLSEVGTAHCALPLFRNALNERAPQLVFDQEFAPEGETFLRVAAEACVAGDATVSNLEQLLLALSFPFGFRNEENGHDDHRRRGWRLGRQQGRRHPAAGSLRAAGILELAKVLVSCGTDVKAERRDGFGVIVLGIHSKRPDMINFALPPTEVGTWLLSFLTFSRSSAFLRVAPEPVLSLICLAKNNASARPASRSHVVSRASARDWIASLNVGQFFVSPEKWSGLSSALARSHADAKRGSRTWEQGS